MTTCSRPSPEHIPTTERRAVFLDTNVLVSAFLARGLCADLLGLVLREHTLVSSEVVLTELRDVLSRKGRLPPAQIDAMGDLPARSTHRSQARANPAARPGRCRR